MHLNLSPSQMLDIWRLHTGYKPSLAESVFLRNDAIDTTAIHRSEMHRWYRRLLMEAPAEQLVAEDLSGIATLSADPDGHTLVGLPPEVVRILKVRLASWRRHARIVTSPTHILALRQNHPYTRATTSHPVAVFYDGELRLYPAATPDDTLLSLCGVSYSEDEYRFDDSVLASIHPV